MNNNFLQSLLLLLFYNLFGATKADLCNQNLRKVQNMSEQKLLQFHGLRSVKQIIVLVPNTVSEFKVEFSDESGIFRDVKDQLGMNRIFLISDLKKPIKFNFSTPIIAKVKTILLNCFKTN